MSKLFRFYLPGLSCGVCVSRVESLLKNAALPLENWHVELDPEQATVWTRDDSQWSDAAVQKALLHLLKDYEPELMDGIDFPTLVKKKIRKNWLLGLTGILAGIAVLVVPLLVATLSGWVLVPLAILSTLLTLALGWDAFRTVKNQLLKKRAPTMDTLFVLSTATVLLVSTLALFVPGLPMMFDVGLFIFGFRRIGRAIEESVRKSIFTGKKFVDRLPNLVLKRQGETQAVIPLKAINPDDVIVVLQRPGEEVIIPIDGIALSAGIIYDTTLSGSITPKEIQAGSVLAAGMTLSPDSPSLEVRATVKGTETSLHHFDQQIAQAYAEKAPLETVAKKILKYFIPGVIALACVAALVISYCFTVGLALQCAAAVLVSACPCTLGFIVPFAIKIGLNKARDNHGVYFKSAKALQLASQVDTVVIDLHGTLTKGEPQVKHYGIAPASALTREAFLVLCAAIEANSSHPIAKAICDEAEKEGVAKSAKNITHIQRYPTGLQASVEGEEYILGNETLMRGAQIELGAFKSAIPLQDEDTIVYLGSMRDKKVVGYMVLCDPLRLNAENLIKHFHAQSMVVHLATGADEPTALRYAKRLGIGADRVKANCRNQSDNPELLKNHYIERLQKAGRCVCMIGDAGNDTLAIAKSDFGMAIDSKRGDILTQQNAGAIVYSKSLAPVAEGFLIAKQTVANIKQSLGFSLIYNMAAMALTGGLLLTLGIALNPSVGVILMLVQTTIILGNAARLKHQPGTQLERQKNNVDLANSSYRRLQGNAFVSTQDLRHAEVGVQGKRQPTVTLAAPAQALGSPVLERSCPAPGVS